MALNPELGTEDFAAAAMMGRCELGVLLDIVPNHMAASSENMWWMSVEWSALAIPSLLHRLNPVTTRGQTVNKVLLPILGSRMARRSSLT